MPQIPAISAVAAMIAAACALGQPTTGPAKGPPTEPIRVGDHLVFPEGAPIPRSLTETERRFLADHPLPSPDLRGPNPAPDSPIFCPPEYAPTDGILIAWESFTPLLTQMIQQITTAGSAIAYVVCDTAAEQTTVNTALLAATGPAVNMSRVRYVIRTTDTVWIRDYGPRYIYLGTTGHQCRAIVDHVYNRPRPNDDVLPAYFSTFKGHPMYSIPLTHGGGNYHLDALGRSYATRLIANENPTLTDPQIIGYWHSFQNVNTTLLTPFPTSIDSTQHLDMWMQIIDDNKVVISDWPSNVGSTQDVICDTQAVAMAAAGYTVYRTPAFSIGGVHYTYTNMVMCNNLVLVPSYSSGVVGATTNATVLATIQGALPGTTIIQLNCDSIIPSAGAMHCVAMHVPMHAGAAAAIGLAPTAYLRTLRGGGPALLPGAVAPISFLADDDVDATTADLSLSYDGGLTFPIAIATAVPIGADGNTTINWTVPNRFIRTGRIRVIVRDADGNTASDQSAADIQIAGTCRADWDGDGLVLPTDVAAYVNSWFTDLTTGTTASDFDSNGLVTPADVAAFVAAWFTAATSGC